MLGLDAGGRTILLAENDPPVRQLIGRVLKADGYRVLEARNGVEAFELASRHKGSIEMVLTDVVMPYMDGFELADRLEAIHPEARVLLVTEQVDTPIAVRNGLTASGRPFLIKPFTRDELRETLDGLLRPTSLPAPAAPAPRSKGARKHRRVSVTLDASWHQGRVHCRTRLTSLSVGGCFLESRDPEPPVGRLRVRVQLPDHGPLWLSGEVAYVQPQRGFGIRFVDVNEQHQARLGYFVDPR